MVTDRRLGGQRPQGECHRFSGTKVQEGVKYLIGNCAYEVSEFGQTW